MAGLYGVRCTVSYREGDRTYTCTPVLLSRTMPYVRCTEVYETYRPYSTEVAAIQVESRLWARFGASSSSMSRRVSRPPYRNESAPAVSGIWEDGNETKAECCAAMDGRPS